MSLPTLFIGVGALKAGTTWVHHFLLDHPECRPCLIKELRYFNKFEGDNPDLIKDRIWNARRRAQGYRDAGITEGEGYTISDLDRLIDDWEALFKAEVLDLNAYRELVMRHAMGAKAVGEITPAYAGLSTQMYAHMHSAAPVTKLFFVMRDPVSRLASQIRMRAAKNGATAEDQAANAAQTADRCLNGGWKIGAARADYVGTISRLRAAVPEQDLHFAYFEDLRMGGTKDLCRFLGIKEMNGPANKKVNEGQPIAMPADFNRRAANMLRPQYDGVADIMGHMPPAWQQSLENAA